MSDAHQPRIAQTLMTMAMVLAEKQPKLAVDYYQRALLIIQQSKMIDDRLLAKCLTALGELYALYKKFKDALQCLHKALIIHRRCLSPEHVNIADVCKTIAMCYLKLNDRSEALRYFNESLGIYQKNYASDHERVKYVEEKIVTLTSEQNTEQILESDITVDPTAAVIDEQQIRVVIDIESPSNLDEQPKVTEKEPKRKRKIACPRCSIL
jgi:tetratricopeptide (TPR) repeat protein